MSSHRCRCGTWTNFGLTCSRCQSEMFDYVSSGDDKEKDPDEQKPVEVPLSELESDEDED